jgi:hypothetical protein
MEPDFGPNFIRFGRVPLRIRHATEHSTSDRDPVFRVFDASGSAMVSMDFRL